MKILRLSTFLDFGGVETRLANISYIQDENDWVFVCMNREGKAAEIIKKNKKKVINLNVSPSIYSFRTFYKIYKIIKKEKPDVIHTSGAEANFHGIIAAKLAGVPIVIGEEIGTPQHSKKAQFIFSKVYRFANFIVGNSELVLKAVHQLDKVPYSKLVKIDNPIIFKTLNPKIKRSNQEAFHILMLSRLETVKNIEAVLRVLARLKKEEGQPIQLQIAGDGSLMASLQQLASSLNLAVEFFGMVKDPYPYLNRADLYILNSFSEGFSNSLVEAMYSKTPSISTAVGAAPEIINDEKNGFLIPADDEVALYQKLKKIMALPTSTLEQIGINGHHTIVENYSLEQHIKALMKLYKSPSL